MGRPILLDLFCGAGGAAMGYYRAGFDILGVDIKPQPRYPFAFVQTDALSFPIAGFNAIHASPPCQHFTKAQHASKNRDAHPNLIDPVRMKLCATGVPWIIENVEGAPLINPTILCGTAFGMEHDGFELRRHRYFESSFPLLTPPSCNHRLPAAPVFGHSAGRDWRDRHGRDFGQDARKTIMNIDWMVREELREAIPPVFTEWIGKQMVGRAIDVSQRRQPA